MITKKTLLAAIAGALLGIASIPAMADPVITLTIVAADGEDSDVCIYTGSDSPGQGGGGCPLLGGTGEQPDPTPSGNGDSYSDASFTYTVGQLITALGGDNLFDVGIDANFAPGQSGSDLLFIFRVIIDEAVAYAFSSDTGTSLQDGNPGTGQGADWFLTPPVDLSGLDEALTVQFYLSMSNNSGGFEQFFLYMAGSDEPDCTVKCEPPVSVPEPGTLALLGMGLVGMGLSRRRKKL